MYKFQIGHNAEIKTRFAVFMKKPHICKENIGDIEFAKVGITGRIVNIEKSAYGLPFIVVMDDESGNFYGTYYTGISELRKLSEREYS